MNYYQRLRELRNEKNLSQEDIAKLLSVKQQQYQIYESGKRELPIKHYVTLATFYNVSLDYLVGISDDKSSFKKTEQPVQCILDENQPKSAL